jgi:hypothetical protein
VFALNYTFKYMGITQGGHRSTLGNLELTNNQEAPDFPAIFRFLGDRYGYWSDDVPHDPIFDPPGIE